MEHLELRACGWWATGIDYRKHDEVMSIRSHPLQLVAALIFNSKTHRRKHPAVCFCLARGATLAPLAVGLMLGFLQPARVLGGVPGVTNKVEVEDPAEAAKDSVAERGSHDFSDIGSWIWETNTYDRQTVLFWKSFEIPSGTAITRARLRITADNEYILYLDGRELGIHQNFLQI